MPSIDSYARVDIDAVGIWIALGTEDRGLSIQNISNSHREIRFVDAAANMNLFLALDLAAGSDVVSSLQRRDWEDLTSSAPNTSTKVITTYGVLKRMPQKVRASLDVLILDQDAN